MAVFEQLLKCFFTLLIFNVYHITAKEYIRACFFSDWAHFRKSPANYLPKNYVDGLCTHIFYAYAKFDDNFKLDFYQPKDKQFYPEVFKYKKNDPKLKILLSIGGWGFGPKGFQKMAKNVKNRETFIKSVLNHTLTYKFDGIDMNWQLPEKGDKKFYMELIKELRQKTKNHKLLLTAMVPGNIKKMVDGFNLELMIKSLDYILLQTYDMHGDWENVTGFNAPLYSKIGDPASVDAVALHVRAHVKPSKTLLGLSLMGRGWTLTGKDRSVGAPATRQKLTRLVNDSGQAGYFEICKYYQNKAEYKFDSFHKVPYLIHNNQWFSYENEDSLEEKIKYVKKNNYAGVFIFALDFDDFIPLCKKKYPLITLIKEKLN